MSHETTGARELSTALLFKHSVGGCDLGSVVGFAL